MPTKEFYPKDIKSKIRVYRDGKEVKPLFATCICMPVQENTEEDGYIDLITLLPDKNGNPQFDEYGLIWLVSDTQLYDDWVEHNKFAKENGLELAPRPMPDVRRYWGKMKWELVR